MRECCWFASASAELTFCFWSKCFQKSRSATNWGLVKNVLRLSVSTYMLFEFPFNSFLYLWHPLTWCTFEDFGFFRNGMHWKSQELCCHFFKVEGLSKDFAVNFSVFCTLRYTCTSCLRIHVLLLLKQVAFCGWQKESVEGRHCSEKRPKNPPFCYIQHLTSVIS